MDDQRMLHHRGDDLEPLLSQREQHYSDVLAMFDKAIEATTLSCVAPTCDESATGDVPLLPSGPSLAATPLLIGIPPKSTLVPHVQGPMPTASPTSVKLDGGVVSSTHPPRTSEIPLVYHSECVLSHKRRFASECPSAPRPKVPRINQGDGPPSPPYSGL
jgi:hypothetical protein